MTVNVVGAVALASSSFRSTPLALIFNWTKAFPPTALGDAPNAYATGWAVEPLKSGSIAATCVTATDVAVKVSMGSIVSPARAALPDANA